MDITTEYNSWYIILCAALAGLYTLLLYGKNPHQDQFKTLTKWTLQIFRFAVVFLLAFLLLNPFIQRWVTEVEEPVIVIAQDLSSSITQTKDSAYYQNQYLTELRELSEKLEKDYTVHFIGFGDEVKALEDSPQFSDKRTNVSQLYSEVEARYVGENIRGLIISSDGLFNAGGNPRYYNFQQSFPIYTIGLGDTTMNSDIAITEIRHNDLAYLGNRFPVEVVVQSQLLEREKAELKVYFKNQLVDTRILDIQRKNQLFTERFIILAEEPGTQTVRVEIKPFDQERNIRNNKERILINVLDNQEKILIVANSPHPDIAAIRGALSSKERYEVDVKLASDLPSGLESYNLIIAHGFGAPPHTAAWEKIWKTEIPLWAIPLGRIPLNALRRFEIGFEVDGRGVSPNNTTAVLNDAFQSFQLSEETRKWITEVPPLKSPYGEIYSFQKSNVLLYQQLGKVKTSLPQLYFAERNSIKTAWLFGDGIWQWKMFDFKRNNNHKQFNELIVKCNQFLAVKEDKSRFRIKTNRKYLENELIKIQAELYDASYESLLNAEIKLALTDQDGNEFDYSFASNAFGYSLQIGQLPPGTYSYEGVVQQGDEILRKTGKFNVEEVNVEWNSLRADHSTLKSISDDSRGEFFLPSQINELADLFSNTDEFPAITYDHEQKNPIIHLKWIFFLLMALVTVEWVIRKYAGRY